MIPNQDPNTPKIYTTASTLSLTVPVPTTLSFSISAYPNCLFIIINENGAIGSIVIILLSALD